MKKLIVTLSLSLFFMAGFSQNSKYEYAGRFTPVIKKEKLKDAIYIDDIMPDFSNRFALPYDENFEFRQLLKLVEREYTLFPQKDFYKRESYNKLIDYVSVQIIATCNGRVVTALATSDVLTKEQKDMINAADAGSDLNVKVRFRYKYQAAEKKANTGSIKEGGYLVTVVPEKEAEFPGGFKQMTGYLNQHIINEIPGPGALIKIQEITVKFTIDEHGHVVNTKILRASADPKVDKLVLDAISKMPAWEPAKNSSGKNVKQEFSIPLGGGGC